MTVDEEKIYFTEKAIISIQNANSSTDYLYAGTPYMHFDAEEFSGATSHLINMKRDVISNITASFPDGLRARASLGTALHIHTLQDFYAHSNWVEIGHTDDINTALGRTTMIDPSSTTAFCPIDPGMLTGAGENDLTSGYYFGVDGCDDEKLPMGKCYHGGEDCHGIHKDTPSRGVEYYTALSLASKATVDYLKQVLDYKSDVSLSQSVAGNIKALKAFMRINGTYGLVVDETSSMVEEIKWLKKNSGNT